MGDDQAKRTDMFLGEVRIVAPGLAALFGFQLSTAFSAAWADLPETLRLVNFASVVSTGLALLFLLAPSAYHRLTHGPEVSDRFIRMVQRDVGIAYGFLALSLTLSLYVQAARTLASPPLALAVAGVFFAGFLLLWGVLPRVRAARNGTHRQVTP